MKETINYYNKNVDTFIQGTISVDMKDIHNRFLDKIDKGAYILDFGCGSGRDTKYFIEQGYRVDAIDGSEELCKRASEYTGIQVKQMLFQELEEQNKYDAIWACSSVLHLPKADLKLVFEKLLNAIKSDGIIYTSFKYSEFEGERNGRYFTDFTLELFEKFIRDISGVKIEEYWITGDARVGREEEKWLNLILRKTKG